nr:hypothetical protein [Tanacetum cinerariifolium]
MADHSQKKHNETSTRCRSSDISDGLAVIQAQLNNLGRKIKKVNEKVYVAQVGYESYNGPHYTQDCPLKEEGKTLEETYYTQFGVPFPQRGRYRAAALGFYQRDNRNTSYQEQRQAIEESLSKFRAESAKRHDENSNLIKEIRVRLHHHQARIEKDFTYKQLKNHWENMKKDWNLYDHLMRLDSGIGWDPIRNTINASAEWWDDKIKANEDLAKFRGLVDEDKEHQEGKGDSDDMNACDDEVPFFPKSSSSKRKKSSRSGRSTKGKTSITFEFDEKLDSVINALSSRST